MGVYQSDAMGSALLGTVQETLDARIDSGLPPRLVLLELDSGEGLIALDTDRRDDRLENPVVAWLPDDDEAHVASDFGSYLRKLCDALLKN